jgi:FKBP-type peptidyl-prolyl cis-trans isomerase FklB
MKQLSFTLILFTAFILNFYSCKNDDEGFVQWKIINQNWLETHKSDPNFHQTASGLCYSVKYQGEMTRPATSSQIKMRLTGRMINNTLFAYNDTVNMSMSSVVSGLQEGLMRMNSGGQYVFYVPYYLAYGEYGNYAGSPVIPPYSTLVFEIELLAVDNKQ